MCIRDRAETAERAGARRLRFADTPGVLEPFGTFERISTPVPYTHLDVYKRQGYGE